MGEGQGSLEGLVMDQNFWAKKNVLVTGHTGFKGGWLALWLSSLGARVHGFALPAEDKSFYRFCNLQKNLASETLANIADRSAIDQCLKKAEPEIIFHLAAQSLVRPSYQSPVETFATNVMGTVHLLESARSAASTKVIVNVTSDKCYENDEKGRAYEESDPMGGSDPYSASKGCAELVATSYRRSFMTSAGIHLASARAGNVIGGGDWAQDRLVPDFLKAWDEKQALVVRAPQSVRPWQHVLEPLNGYVTLAKKLHLEGASFAEGWNFGPDDRDSKTVEWIVTQLTQIAAGSKWEKDHAAHPHEAKLLSLNSKKSRARLGWQPRWDVTTALQKTCDWHQAWRNGVDMHSFSLKQIGEYHG